MKTIAQGKVVVAACNFACRRAQKGRPMRVKKGDRFWITNTKANQSKYGVFMLDREGQGHISQGFGFSWDQMVKLFSANNLPSSFFN